MTPAKQSHQPARADTEESCEQAQVQKPNASSSRRRFLQRLPIGVVVAGIGATVTGVAIQSDLKPGARTLYAKPSRSPGLIEIRDGNPAWWNSPDIWTVPGNDPNGAPGHPIAEAPCYVWGRVTNHSSSNVMGARVDFYWSNPATGVLRSNSTLIGFAFVDLMPGEQKDVLCLTPWVPVFVNDGHECLVAEVLHELDPLPSPPPDPFDPPTYNQIAQKNLTVVRARKGRRVMPIQVSASPEQGKFVRLTLDVGGKLDGQTLKQAGVGHLRATEQLMSVGLSLLPECDEKDCRNTELKLEVEPGTSRQVYAHIFPERVEDGTYELVHVMEDNGETILGGITFIVTTDEKGGK